MILCVPSSYGRKDTKRYHWGRFSLALLGDKENRPQWINRVQKLSVCSNEALQKNRFVKLKIEQK